MKNPHAVELGRLGRRAADATLKPGDLAAWGRKGAKRAAQNMTPEQRKERARRAGLASAKARRNARILRELD